MRKAMEELKQRFPEDVAYDVFWDTTVFVTATIEEVVHTLVDRLRAGRRSWCSCSSASCARR